MRTFTQVGEGTHTATAKKQIIRNALAGKNRNKVAWTPRWLTFPQGAYTSRTLTLRPRRKALLTFARICSFACFDGWTPRYLR